jgi:hypothetical protein
VLTPRLTCPATRCPEAPMGTVPWPPRALRALAHEAVVTEDGPNATVRWSQRCDPGSPASSSTVVPLAHHSQRS